MPEVPGVREPSQHLQRIGVKHNANSTTRMFSPRDQGNRGSHYWDQRDPAGEIGVAADEVCRTQNCEDAEPAESDPPAETPLQGAAGKQNSQPADTKLPSSRRQLIERKSAFVACESLGVWYRRGG